MAGWLLLIHRVPARPLYLRARVRALLAQAGAVALKPSVYAVPARAGTREALQAIAAEVGGGGGQAVLCEARFGAADEERLVEAGRRERARDYAALRRAAGERPATAGRLRHLERRLARIAAADHFHADGRREGEAAVAGLRRRAAATPPTPWVGRTWVTRRGVHVDRMACAWYVRRFLDPGARFRFTAAGEAPGAGEIGFDMPGGTFTHAEDRCSFETLIAGTGRPDAALRHVAEIVHDLDLKDGRFGRAEAAGLGQVIAGIAAAEPDDAARIERGAALFDDLHRAFTGRPQPTLPPRLRPRSRSRP